MWTNSQETNLLNNETFGQNIDCHLVMLPTFFLFFSRRECVLKLPGFDIWIAVGKQAL